MNHCPVCGELYVNNGSHHGRPCPVKMLEVNALIELYAAQTAYYETLTTTRTAPTMVPWPARHDLEEEPPHGHD